MYTSSLLLCRDLRYRTTTTTSSITPIFPRYITYVCGFFFSLSIVVVVVAAAYFLALRVISIKDIRILLYHPPNLHTFSIFCFLQPPIYNFDAHNNILSWDWGEQAFRVSKLYLAHIRIVCVPILFFESQFNFEFYDSVEEAHSIQLHRFVLISESIKKNNTIFRFKRIKWSVWLSSSIRFYSWIF